MIVGSLLAIGFTANAQAAIQLDKTSGSWSNTIGGSNVVYQAVGTEAQVRWGIPYVTEQSGLGFTGIDYTPGLVPGPGEFKLGTLRHHNFVVQGGTAASSSSLAVLFDLASPDPDINLNYVISIDETLNAAPCVYPGATICPDKVTISPSSQTFIFQGGTYSLDSYFKDSTGALVDYMITEENQVTPADLWGRVSLLIPPPTPTPVPSPLPLFGAAAAFGYSRKLRARIAVNRRSLDTLPRPSAS